MPAASSSSDFIASATEPEAMAACRQPKVAQRPWVQKLYLLGGFVMVGLAVLGALLPGLPTTIFLILALWCFGRSSPQRAARLLAHPRYGLILQQWQQYRLVPRRAKYLATVGMSAGWLLLFWQQGTQLWLWALAALELAVLLWLWQLPSQLPQNLALPSTVSKPVQRRWLALLAQPWCRMLLLSLLLHLLLALWWLLEWQPPPLAPVAMRPPQVLAVHWIDGAPAPLQASTPAAKATPAAAPAPAKASQLKPTRSPAPVKQRVKAAPQPPLPRQITAPAAKAVAAPATQVATTTAPSATSNTSEEPAASQSSSASASQQSLRQQLSRGLASWQAEVMAKLELQRRYPASALRQQLQGVVYLRLQLGRDGQLMQVQLVRSSGHQQLDQAAEQTVRQSAPYPALPAELTAPYQLLVPIEFFIRG